MMTAAFEVDVPARFASTIGTRSISTLPTGPTAPLLVAITTLCLAVSAGQARGADVETPRPVDRSFGVRQDADTIAVDTGAGLVFKVSRNGQVGRARRAGDIVSMTYGGVQYQDQDKGSQVNSGFSDLYDGQTGVDVSSQRVDADHIKITVRAGDLVHYYMAKRGEPAIFMATYFTREPKPNFVRFIARIPRGVLPDGPPAADVSRADHQVESRDIFGLADGETRSKHYSNMRLKDWRYFGARGPNVGVWMVRDDNEGGSGGPFYRSLLDQGAPADQELTYIVNYGEIQTEPYRMGVLDAYTLVFTTGTVPKLLDTDWFSRMNLSGYVSRGGRGRVTGAGLDGMDPSFAYTVGFANVSAQYWTDATSLERRFERSNMRPGTYRLTVYKNEMAVATREVTVAAGRTTALERIHLDDPDRTPSLWRIGRWDGTPTEFLNGTKMTSMHPSDARMASWKVGPFVVGRSSASEFPACEWADVNAPLRVNFTLSPTQIAAVTLRIGVTVAFADARPTIAVNDWASAIPASTVQPTSRSLTVGSYRGNNQMFVFAIPATALKSGENELRISIASGKHGSGYLSPGVAYDAIDLLPR